MSRGDSGTTAGRNFEGLFANAEYAGGQSEFGNTGRGEGFGGVEGVGGGEENGGCAVLGFMTLAARSARP